jgi:hypothetical protein
VAWGALHGIYLMINHLWRSLLARCNIRQIVTSTGYRITAFLLTYFAVIVAWVFFRAETFPAALSILRSMLGLNGISLPPALAPYAGVFDGSKLIIFQGAGIQGGSQAVFWIITTMLITLTFPNTQQLMRRWLINPINPDIPYRGSFSWQPNLRYALLLSFVAAAALIMVIVGRSSEFLYFQF